MFDSSVLLLLLLGLIAAFWVDSVRAKEVATAKARALCASHEVQFLDESAALSGLRLGRTGSGLRFQRTYSFGYYRDELGRRQGSITLVGTHIHSYRLDSSNVIEADFWQS